MPETTILCGGLGSRGHGDASVLCLDVDAPEGSPNRVNLNIGQISRSMVADIPDRLVDLLQIAAYVYATDQFVSRGGRTMALLGRAWRRDLRFTIPVRDFQFWQRGTTVRHLVETLRFLSDDYYSFRFEEAKRPRPISSYLDLHGDGAPTGFDPDRVALFSGGLDSLAGAATALIQDKQRVALVSHHASPMIWSRQAELIQGLRSRVSEGRIFHVGVTVTKGTDEAREFTQRTRSFLFGCLALVVARLFRKSELVFYENGIVSINLPLAEQVVGVRATRTTHPKVLADFSKLFSLVSEEQIRIINPYFWVTKSEVLHKISDAGCADLVARSFSCSHVRLATQTRQQCGVCTQCLDRRFAILATGMQGDDPADGYAIDLLHGSREAGPELTLAEAYVVSAIRFVAMSQVAFLARYGQIFRCLPHLEGRNEELAARIYEMHRRHGRSVRHVIEQARLQTSVEAMLELPPTCLLSLVHSSFGSPAIVKDPTETELLPAEQAKTMEGPWPATRPIIFWLNRSERRVTFANRVLLKGVSYGLVEALLAQYVDDLRAGVPRSAFGYVQAESLAEALGIEEPSLRPRIARFRNRVADGFLEELSIALARDDIVENDSGRGYRLNPFLELRPPADSRSEVADVTAGRGLSQILPRNR